MAARVIQFGTSRFLQAHADLFIHEARETGQDIGPITVVKTTAGAERAGRVAAFADPHGFPVRIRGSENGQSIDKSVQVRSVVAALDATRDWPALVELFAHQTEIVISNVGERGYGTSPEDHRRPPPDTLVPASFPAKLLLLLRCRHDRGGGPLLILPCELVSNNGQVLRQTLTKLAQDWGEPTAFTDWLATSVTICDTLVDRIVSQSIEPIGAVAEPYGLWAIRHDPGMVPPFTHPKMTYTDDLTPFLRLKLHILNLGHTYLAEIWQTERRPSDETVRAILSDPEARTRVLSLYRDEVVPGFAARGMGEAAAAYVRLTVERFDNPFLDHRMSDIAQDHAIKIERRVAAFLAWVQDVDPSQHLPRLQHLGQGSLAAMRARPLPKSQDGQ